MSTDPRAALDAYLAAIERHFEAASRRRGDADPEVEAAYSQVADAFEAYEDALFEAYDEVLPFELYDDVEDAREDEEFDELDLDTDEEDLAEEDEDGELDDVEDLDPEDLDVEENDTFDEDELGTGRASANGSRSGR